MDLSLFNKNSVERIRIKTFLTVKISFGAILFEKTRINTQTFYQNKMPASSRPFCLADDWDERWFCLKMGYSQLSLSSG